MPEDGEELAELFGGETGDEIDKFARCAWHEGPAGLPILDDLPNWFAARILRRMRGGDHDALVLEPIAAEREAEENELTFHRVKRIGAGARALARDGDVHPPAARPRGGPDRARPRRRAARARSPTTARSCA